MIEGQFWSLRWLYRGLAHAPGYGNFLEIDTATKYLAVNKREPASNDDCIVIAVVASAY